MMIMITDIYLEILKDIITSASVAMCLPLDSTFRVFLGKTKPVRD